MAGGSMNDTDMVKQLAQHWGLVLLFGLMTLALGIIMATSPGMAGVSFALLVGIEIFVAGVYRALKSFGHDAEGHRLWWMVLGVLGMVAGVFMVRHPIVSIVAFGIVVGVFWFANGFFELFAALSDPGMPSRGWMMFMGLIGILAGATLMFAPLNTFWLIEITGIFMAAYGAMTAITSFGLKKAAAAV